MTLIPIASPRLPPIWDTNPKTDISFLITYFKIFSSVKKTLTIPISFSKASYLEFISKSFAKIAFDFIPCPRDRIFEKFVVLGFSLVVSVLKNHGIDSFDFSYSFCATVVQGAGFNG